MKKFLKQILICFACLILVSAIIFLIGMVAYEPEIKPEKDDETGVFSFEYEGKRYIEINAESVDCGFFSKETECRIDNIYINSDNRVYEDTEDIKILNNSIFGSKYGYKQINENERLFFYIPNQRPLEYYAEEGFELPELNIKNIEYMILEYPIASETIYENGERIIYDVEEIAEILNNPYDYFEKNSLVCLYVKYNQYDFTEFYNADFINQETKVQHNG